MFECMCVVKTSFFQLCIMDTAGVERLKKAEKVCIDARHGMGQHEDAITLTTFIVPDDNMQGRPVAHFLSTGTSQEVMQPVFQAIKDLSGPLSIEWFMSDDDMAFYNTWSAVFGAPTHKLLCKWHVLRAWEKALKKIGEEQPCAAVGSCLRILIDWSLSRSASNAPRRGVGNSSRSAYFNENSPVRNTR